MCQRSWGMHRTSYNCNATCTGIHRRGRRKKRTSDAALARQGCHVSQLLTRSAAWQRACALGGGVHRLGEGRLLRAAGALATVRAAVCRAGQQLHSSQRSSKIRWLGSTLSRMQLHYTDAYYRGRPDEAATQGGVGEAARRLTPVMVCYGT